MTSALSRRNAAERREVRKQAVQILGYSRKFFAPSLIANIERLGDCNRRATRAYCLDLFLCVLSAAANASTSKNF